MASISKFLPVSSKINPSSPSFQPRLLFADSLKFPPLDFLASPANHIPFQKRPRHRSSHFQNSSRYSQISEIGIRSACFRCGGRGHYVRSCLAPVRCFRCGSFGHKRAECRRSSKLYTESSSPIRSGCEDVSWSSHRADPPERVDCMLLDPNVTDFLDRKSVDQELTSTPGLKIPDLSEPQLAKALFGSSLVRSFFERKDLVSLLGQRLNHGKKSRATLGKRVGYKMPLVSRVRMLQREKPWSLCELLKMESSRRVAEPRIPDSEVSFPYCYLKGDKRSSDSPSPTIHQEKGGPLFPLADDCGSAEKNKKTLLGLPPAPFDTISSFIILDEFETYFSDDKQTTVGFPNHNSGREALNSSGMDTLSPPKPRPKVKEPSTSKKLQRSGSQISIRRSPRLMKK